MEKGAARIDVSFELLDLAKDPEAVFAHKADLVTASALFDLVSESYIKAFVRALAASGAAFYTVLTYNGLQNGRRIARPTIRSPQLSTAIRCRTRASALPRVLRRRRC